MRRRPREHVRRVRTKHGRRAVVVNKGVKRKPFNPYSQVNLKAFFDKNNKEADAKKRIEKLFEEYSSQFGDDRILRQTLGVKRKSGDHLTPPKGSLLSSEEKKEYGKIIKTARRKGYSIPKVDLKKGPVVLDEVNIPETFETEAFLLPDNDAITGEDTYLIQLDDDATLPDKKKALAHELGHVHMYDKNIKPHTEGKADQIAARIIGTTVKDIQQSEHLKDNLARLDTVKRKKGEWCGISPCTEFCEHKHSKKCKQHRRN